MRLRMAAWLSPRIPGPVRRFILRRVLRRRGLSRKSVKTVLPALDAIAGSRAMMSSLTRIVARFRR